ncbi:unnamed protein product [Linum trigynum]|uniref:Reverse transcriptase zinc-binding domain-containing protein n=1 Tax=Linum trigynum TaxID=586398 RepID=A0AAV2DCZ6_9ROSI
MEIGTLRVIGSGDDTWFHRDPWVHPLHHHKISSHLDPPSRVSDWMNEDRKSWNTNLIQRHCSSEEADAISRIHIGPAGSKDKWVWKFTTDGAFSVRSAYHELRKNQRDQILPRPGTHDLNIPTSDDCWNWLWSLNLPPKIRFFLWRCIRNALATKLNLHRRRCSPNPKCQLCNAEVETAVHCMFLCPHASATWARVAPLLSQPQNLSQWIFSLRESESPDSLRRKIYCLWNIWKARNEFIFRGTVLSPTLTSICAFRDAAEPHYAAVSSATSSHPRDFPSHSCPPPVLHHKRIHCDGSFDHGSQEAAIRVVITISNGQICDGRARKVICSSPIEAEACAILEACRLAAEDTCPATILSDSKVMVDAINEDPSCCPWRCYALLAHIKDFLHQTSWVNVLFTNRRNNKNADWVARNCRIDSLHPKWLSVLNVVSELM